MEITLAIGVVALAIVPVFSLIPTGLTTFHRAIDASVASQIAQRLINQAQQTDFKALTGGATTRFVQTPAVRYFDDQGIELTSNATSAAIYRTQVVVVPNTQTAGSQEGNSNLATVIVQIANNPAGVPLVPDGQTLLWTSNNNANVSMLTYSMIVANNQ